MVTWLSVGQPVVFLLNLDIGRQALSHGLLAVFLWAQSLLSVRVTLPYHLHPGHSAPHNSSVTQQKSYSISHLLSTVTTLWPDSDCVVTVDNCWQSGDYTAICSSDTVLSAVFNSRYTVTIQSQCSDCAYSPIVFDKRVTIWLYPCLVHVCLLGCGGVRVRNGYTQACAQIMQHTCTH